MKELEDNDLEVVSGGIGFDFENDFKPMEVDLPWWQRGPESPAAPPSTGDPMEQQFGIQDDAVPSWWTGCSEADEGVIPEDQAEQMIPETGP